MMVTPPGEEPGPAVRIGELARRSGVPAATLRAWERRYGVLTPRRGESGYRLYSSDDEMRLRAMVRLIDEGVAPAEAAERVRAHTTAVLSTAPDGSDDPAPMLEDARRSLLDALIDYDELGAGRQLDRVAAALSIEAFVGGLILPVLRDIGDRWAGGEAGVGEEHFASSLIRGRLLGIARGWGTGDGATALLACPAGERHDLGLICFGLMLRSRGWRITFLGADTPGEAILSCAGETNPRIAVAFARSSEPFEEMEPALEAIAAVSALHLAGSGAEPELCARVGAEHLDGDPVEAAELLLV